MSDYPTVIYREACGKWRVEVLRDTLETRATEKWRFVEMKVVKELRKSRFGTSFPVGHRFSVDVLEEYKAFANWSLTYDVMA